MDKDLIKQFELAMIGIYEQAKEKYGYNDIRFLQMIKKSTGIAVAHGLLRTSKVSGVLAVLYAKGGQEALKLTVEYLALDPKWSSLFNDTQLKRAKQRLGDFK